MTFLSSAVFAVGAGPMCLDFNLPVFPDLEVGSVAVVFFVGLAAVVASFLGVVFSIDAPAALSAPLFKEFLVEGRAGAVGAERIEDAAVTCTPLPEMMDIVARPEPTDKVSPDIPGAFAPTK